jgi:hypothetical protein
MFVLAISDNWVVGMWAANMLISVGLGFGLYFLGRGERSRASAFKALEDKLAAASGDGKALTEKLVEERLRAASHEVTNQVQGFISGLEVLRQRTADAAEEFKELNEADHENRLTIATQIAGLKDWMWSAFANKGDVAKIDESVRTLEQKVAVLSDREKAAGGGARRQ